MILATEPVVDVSGLETGYGRVRILEEVSLQVMPGEMVTVVGANGAGKTTLLRTLSGLLRPWAGAARVLGHDVRRLRADQVVRLGAVHVPEGRRIFRHQTVEENLELGLYALRLDAAARNERYADVYARFPVLKARRRAPAATLSGGEQQMLAVAQALMRRPVVLMLDEPSLGLSPLLVREVFRAIEALRGADTAVILVEQFVDAALSVSDRAYVMRHGRVVASGRSAELRGSDTVRRAYTGIAGRR